jgi:phage-related baseplate assembly protein
MPVEINELVIRASITAPETAQQSVMPLGDNQQKMQQVLDEVMKKLNDKDER